MSTWIYNGQPFLEAPEDAFGFVYLITNKVNNRQYIGKKQIRSFLTKQVPGRKNRTHYTKESSWRDYWSSCKELQEDVKKYGEENFVREVVRIYPNKAQLTMGEVELQFKSDVLTATLPDNSPAYYNRNIMNRFFSKLES